MIHPMGSISEITVDAVEALMEPTLSEPQSSLPLSVGLFEQQ